MPKARFADSEHSQRDDYDARRYGSRHGRVHAETRDEIRQQRDEALLQQEAWLHEVRTIIEQSDQILSEMPPQHAAAARALQDARRSDSSRSLRHGVRCSRAA